MRERRNQLAEIAGAQDGFFTAAQARQVGYSHRLQHLHWNGGAGGCGGPLKKRACKLLQGSPVSEIVLTHLSKGFLQLDGVAGIQRKSHEPFEWGHVAEPRCQVRVSGHEAVQSFGANFEGDLHCTGSFPRRVVSCKKNGSFVHRFTWAAAPRQTILAAARLRGFYAWLADGVFPPSGQIRLAV